MTVTAIREKLHDYISNTDDDQIKGLYEIFEDQIGLQYDWSTDNDFVAELNDRVKKWEDASEPGGYYRSEIISAGNEKAAF